CATLIFAISCTVKDLSMLYSDAPIALLQQHIRIPVRMFNPGNILIIFMALAGNQYNAVGGRCRQCFNDGLTTIMFGINTRNTGQYIVKDLLWIFMARIIVGQPDLLT